MFCVAPRIPSGIRAVGRFAGVSLLLILLPFMLSSCEDVEQSGSGSSSGPAPASSLATPVLELAPEVTVEPDLEPTASPTDAGSSLVVGVDTDVVSEPCPPLGGEDLVAVSVEQLNGLKWKFLASDVVRRDPVLVNGVVLFGADDKRLYAVDAQSGELLWRIPLEHDGIFLAGSGELVYAAAGSSLYAVDPLNGEIRWSHEAFGLGRSYPAVVDGVVYVGGWDGRMHALDAETGETVWAYDAGAEVRTGFRSSPAVWEGSVYISTTSGILYSFDVATGEVLWQSRVGKRGNYKSPAAGGGLVFLPDESHLYAFDASGGALLWKIEIRLAEDSRMTVSGGVLYFIRGAVVALDAATGDELWRHGGSGEDYLYV